MKSNKILDIDGLSEVTIKLKKQGKKIIYCHGCFDLMHIGHIKYLQSAKNMGDVLIVTITPDKYVKRGPGRPVFDEFHRAESIAALNCVDYVAINKWPTAVEAIYLLKPHLYVKGADFGSAEADATGRLAKEKEAINEVGGEITFTKEEVFSSTKLLKDYFGVLPKELDEFLVGFTKRFKLDDLLDFLSKIRNLRILVIGEPIIDEYHFCEPLQKASKSAIISTKYEFSEAYLGGALCIVNHLAGFIDEVGLIALLGREDSKEEFVRKNLKQNVKLFPCFRDDGPTIVKRRFLDRAFAQKMFEVCYFNDYPINERVEEEALDLLNQLIPKYDMVISADFGHGFFTSKIINLLCEKSPYLVVMSQSNSANFGYNLVTKYKRADYIVLDHVELRLSCHDKHNDYEPMIEKLSEKLSCSKINVTLGHEGAIYYYKDNNEKKYLYKVPVASWKIVDTIGAGDAVLAITSPLTYLGLAPEAVAFIGNCAGALAVQYLGNKESIDPAHLTKLIQTFMK